MSTTDKTKVKGAKVSTEDELSLIKCVLKVMMEGSDKDGKPRTIPIPWEKVAGYMQTNVKADSLRKRFDKVKKAIKEIAAIGEVEAEGEAGQIDPAAVKTAKAVPKKAPAMRHTYKGMANAKVDDADDEDATSSQEGDEAVISTTETNHEEKKPKTPVKPHTPRKKAVKAEVAEPNVKENKKRAHAVDDGLEGTPGSDGSEDELTGGLPTPPKRARSTKDEAASKTGSTISPADEVEVEGGEIEG